MKIYKEADSAGEPILTSELVNKIKYMISNPPDSLISKGIIAWPIASVTEEGQGFVGFVMPRLDVDEHILRVYSYRHPVLDSIEYGRFPSIESRIKIAINLCSALHELHRHGYVFGDFNHHNVGVNYSTGQIYFMDCDSFHITDKEGAVFRTNVIMAGYLAPEIIYHCNLERASDRPHNLDKVSLPTFTKESDLFCLAVHIFKLLMNGVDPFRGVKSEAEGSTASPFVGNDAIERNAYVFREGNKPSAVFCLPAASLPPDVLSLFNRAFIDGRNEPTSRPSAEEWYHSLGRYLFNDLTQCTTEPKHQYYVRLAECPYCEADDRHQKAQGGFIKNMYRDHPADVRESNPFEIIKKSKQRTRKFHIIFSLIMWTSFILIYAVWNLSHGYTTIMFNPSNWHGFELIFVFAALIECIVEIFFCRKELAVLSENIIIREIDPKFCDFDLRGYKERLNDKILLMVLIAIVLIIVIGIFGSTFMSLILSVL